MKIINANKNLTVFSVLICAVFWNFACTPRSFEKPNTAAPTATVEDKQAEFNRDVQTMKTANLKYVFVFRRKDGGKFDGEDKGFLRTNLSTTNRTILADEEKAVIVGTNYEFPPSNLETLRTRFNVEDLSASEPVK